MLTRLKPKDYLADNTLVLEIYYSTLQYIEIISEPAYSQMALLSDIGGALSLLLGSTLLTVYEVFEFAVFAQLGHRITASRRQTSNNNSQQTSTDT